MPILHGADGSPFVRKVIVVLKEKGISYDHNPVVPFNQPPEYMAKSPLGKIPCWEDDGYALPDSSCIIAYLERTKPTPAVYPSDAKQFGRALWYEEYGDTKLVQAVGTVFFQRLIRPMFMKQDPDNQAIKKAIEEEIPPIFDYLEREVGDRQYLVGDKFSIADIGIASPFVNYSLAGESVDKKRWPKLAGYVERIHSRESFKQQIEKEKGFFSRAKAS